MAWNPWTYTELTAGNRPLLEPDEIELFVSTGVGLYLGDEKIKEYQSGRIYLTDKRICYVDNNDLSSQGDQTRVKSVGIYLKYVVNVRLSTRFLRSSAKITLVLDKRNPFLLTNNHSNSDLRLNELQLHHQIDKIPNNLTGLNNDSLQSSLREFTWVCPICYYSNSLPVGFQIELDQIQPCKTCGVTPSFDLIKREIETQCKDNNKKGKPNSNDMNNSIKSSSRNDFVRSSNSSNVRRKTESSGFACPRCTFVNHPSLRQCEICGAILKSDNLPSKLRNLNLNDDGDRIINKSDEYNKAVVKISFRNGGESSFYEKLQVALEKGAWKTSGRNSKVSSSQNLNNSSVEFGRNSINSKNNNYKNNSNNNKNNGPKLAGIHGLEKMSKQERMKNSAVLGESLSDLQELMSSAEKVVSIAKTLAQQLANSPDGIVTPEAKILLKKHTQSIGLATPNITMESVSSTKTYYSELSRQVSDFLSSGVIEREGGVITLVDLYAIYNRARGFELISPEDLCKSVEQFEILNLPYKIRRFKSGVLVIIDKNTLANNERNVLELVYSSWDKLLGVTPRMVSSKFGWSTSVALDELEMMENEGKVCRDVTVEGIKFYPNIISEYIMGK